MHIYVGTYNLLFMQNMFEHIGNKVGGYWSHLKWNLVFGDTIIITNIQFIVQLYNQCKESLFVVPAFILLAYIGFLTYLNILFLCITCG